MAGTRWPEVVAALLTTMRARAGYRDPNNAAASGTLIPVYRSTAVGLTADNVDTYLVIAWSGDPDNPQPSGRVRQTIATGGKVTRDDVGTIECLAVSQNGSYDEVDIVAAEVAAFAVLADVEAAIRSDPTLGLTPNPRLFIQMEEAAAIRSDLNEGAVCKIDFTITYSARI